MQRAQPLTVRGCAPPDRLDLPLLDRYRRNTAPDVAARRIANPLSGLAVQLLRYVRLGFCRRAACLLALFGSGGRRCSLLRVSETDGVDGI